MGKSKTKQKKNELSNAVHQALLGALSQNVPEALLRGPVVWSSQTKGKLSVWLSKDHKLTKEQSGEVEDVAATVIEGDVTVDSVSLKKAGVFDEDAKQATTTAKVEALSIPKFNMRFFRPNEEKPVFDDGKDVEWELQILIGKPAVAARAKKTAEGGGAAAPAKEEKTESKKSKKSKKKDKAAPKAKVALQKNSPSHDFALKLIDEVVLSSVKDITSLTEDQAAALRATLLLDMETLVSAFHNTAYSSGFAAGLSAASPNATDLLKDRL